MPCLNNQVNQWIYTMQDSNELKAQARKLLGILKDLGIAADVGLTQAQEIVSRQNGFRNRHEILSKTPKEKVQNTQAQLPKCPLCLDSGFHAEVFAGFPPVDRPAKVVACRCGAVPEFSTRKSELEAELADTRAEFNRIINFCLLLDNRFEADTILTLWREGSWESLENEFGYARPEFAKVKTR